jgi:hypothetical protein
LTGSKRKKILPKGCRDEQICSNNAQYYVCYNYGNRNWTAPPKRETINDASVMNVEDMNLLKCCCPGVIIGPMTFPGDPWSLSGQNSPNFGQNAWYSTNPDKMGPKCLTTQIDEVPENFTACVSIRTNISMVQKNLDLTPGPVTYH